MCVCVSGPPLTLYKLASTCAHMYKRIAESRSLSCCAATMEQVTVLRGMDVIMEMCGIADEDDGVNKLFIGTPFTPLDGGMVFIIPLKRFKSNLTCGQVTMALQQKFDGVCPLGCYKENEEHPKVIKDGVEAEYVMNGLRLMLE